MAEDEDIQLGMKVRDRISGYVGIVTDIGYHLTGCTRFGVMPSDTDNESHRGETEFFYGAQLEIVEKETQFTDAGAKAIKETDFELGDEVVDDVTEFKGLATTITHNLFNCPRVAITPLKQAIDADDTDRFWCDAPRVERIGDGISANYETLINEGTTAQTGASNDIKRKSDKR